jgi:type I restriction enzyme S subunit
MEKYKLEDICSLITDGTHQTPVYCDESGYIFLSSKDVTTRKINWEDTKYIPEELHEKLYSRLKPQVNDILLAKNGTTGVAAIVDKDIVFDIYVSLALLRPEDIVYPKYLLYFINSSVAKRQFNKGLKGIGVPNLHLSTIRKTELKLPNIDKQKEISSIFDILTGLIEKRQKQLDSLDDLIKSRFVEMFGDARENTKSFEQVQFENIVEYMGDIGSNGANKVVVDHLDMKNEEDYALMVRFTNFTKNDFTDDVKYVSKEAYNFFKKSQIFGGELIICKIGSAGQNYIMPYLDRPVSLGLNQIMVRITDRILMPYLYQYLHTDYGKFLISGCINGAVTKTITKTELKKIPVMLPPMDLQQQFSDLVAQVDKLKVEVKRALDETQILFDSLMHQYFE